MYSGVDPWGEDRDDLRFALLCTVVAQGAGNRRARPAQFLLSKVFKLGGVARQSQDTMLAQWKAFVSRHNSRQKRGK